MKDDEMERARALLIECAVRDKSPKEQELFRSGRAGFYTVDFNAAIAAMLAFAQQPEGSITDDEAFVWRWIERALYERSRALSRRAVEPDALECRPQVVCRPVLPQSPRRHARRSADTRVMKLWRFPLRGTVATHASHRAGSRLAQRWVSTNARKNHAN